MLWIFTNIHSHLPIPIYSLFIFRSTFSFHSGNWLSNAKSNKTFEIGKLGSTAISRSYKALRINNRIINDIDKAPLTPEQKNEILGQAYFYRSWFYFQITKDMGGCLLLTRSLKVEMMIFPV